MNTSLSQLERIDSICIEFEQAWKQSSRPPPSIGAFLQRAPANERSLLFYDLFTLDLEYRQQRGVAIPTEDYIRRYPQYTDAIHRGVAVQAARSTHAPQPRSAQVRSAPARSAQASAPRTDPRGRDAVRTRTAQENQEQASSSRPHPPLSSKVFLAETLGEDWTGGPCSGPPVIREYQLVRPLGRGGMGRVFLAWHTRLKAWRALKLLHTRAMNNPEAIARFEHEALAGGQLKHENIVQTFDAGEENGVHFLAMEYIEGLDIQRLVRDRGQLPVSEACELVRQAALGLAHAHENQLIHRDVKPSNLMLSQDGSVKVLDLGLAQLQALSSGLTQPHQILGTILYMAPEQLRGRVSPACDIYSLGVTFWEMLAGELPPPHGLGTAVLSDIRRLRPDLPEELARVVSFMTAQLPEQRPPSMRQVAALVAIGESCSDLPSLARGCTQASVKAVVSSQAEPSGNPASFSVEGYPETQARRTTSVADTGMQQPENPTPDSNSLFGGPDGTPSYWVLGLLLCGFVLLASVGFLGSLSGHPEEPNNPGNREDDQAQNGHQGDHLPEDLQPDEAVVTIQSPDPLCVSLVRSGRILATHKATQRIHRLIWGENRLPPGEYFLTVNNPKLQLGLTVSEFDCVPGDDRLLEPSVRFNSPWRFPTIPEEPGAFATYTGTLIVRAGPVSRDLTCDIDLSVLGEEADGGVWLHVKIHNHQDYEYSEQGYLLVDKDHWRNANQLLIQRGWLIAESSRIRDSLAAGIDKDPANRPTKLVALFDEGTDTLKKMATTLTVPLPEQRISVHEVLTLLFGREDLVPVPKISRGLRAAIAAAGPPQLNLTSEVGPRGSIDCVRVHTRNIGDAKEAKPLYELYRNDSLNFSFLGIRVNWHSRQQPLEFEASLKLKNCGTNPKDLPDEELYKRQYVVLNEGQERYPFDRASLPHQEGVSVVYEGTLEIAGGPAWFYETTIRAGGRKIIDGKSHRWFEVQVDSRPEGVGRDYCESAAILIDEDKFDEREFVIHHGWIHSSGHTFRLKTDRTTKKRTKQFVPGLMILGKGPPPGRLKIEDVLTLLFDAELEGSQAFVNLRREFRGKIREAGLHRLCEQGDISLPDDPNQKVFGARWSAPDGLPFAYTIERSRQTPFNFIFVRLVEDGKIDFKASLNSIRHQAPALLPPEDKLIQQWTATKASIDELTEDNLRIWTAKAPLGIKHYWAEFLAEFTDQQKYVAFLPAEGDAVFIPKSLLEQEDQKFINDYKGRIWRWTDQTGEHHDVAQYAGQQGDNVRLRLPDQRIREIPFEFFCPEDKRWTEAYRKVFWAARVGVNQ